MRIQILGPISAWRDHEPLNLGPAAQRAMLGLLTIVSGQPVSHTEILAAVWPDRLPPPTARNVIQTHVKHLRSILEPDRRRRAPSKILRQVGDGYALHVPASAVDVARFRHQVTAATGLAHRGEINGAADLLGQSLALWNGSPLAGRGRHCPCWRRQPRPSPWTSQPKPAGSGPTTLLDGVPAPSAGITRCGGC